MVAPTLARKKVWILPIVLLVAAVMVLPASTVLAQHSGPASAAAASSSAAPALAGAGHSSALASRLAEHTLPHATTPALSLSSSIPSSLVAPAPSTFQPSSLFNASGAVAGASKLDSTELSATLAKINATFAGVPDSAAEAAVQRSIAEGKLPARAAYLPNLHLLSEPATSPVSPTYNVSPAPMGIADFGLSASGAYTVYTPDVLGSVTLEGYNASAGALYQDTGAYYWNGLSPNAGASPWQSGLQLNTVVSNVSYPGADTGIFWTQNVIDLSANSLQFIDNIWNFTAPNSSIDYSTIYSGNGTVVPGELYYDYGPTLPVSFPMTIELYNNASNVNDRTTIKFGYRVTEGTAVFTGIYDTIAFNSQPSGAVPLNTPEYLIDGFQPTYTEGPYQGPLFDAELIFGGPGDGSNAVINSLNGSMNLDYHIGSSWTPARAAYDYGADTGETAIGFAGWWQGSTEYVNQGPSLLYGLWNTSTAVPSGEWELILHNYPSYAFDFAGFLGTTLWNLSYMPSAENGTAETWLPPSIDYAVTIFADGFDQISGIVEGGPGTVGIPGIFWEANPTVWNAPIYLNGPGQALSFAQNATGWVSGPYNFTNLTVDVNLTFNHLNDWGFPEFDLFWAYDVAAPLIVNNVTQGPDSSGGLCSGVDETATCYLAEYPFGYADLPYYGSEIADWYGADASFENLTLYGWVMPIGIFGGGAVSLWDITDAYAYNITSDFDTYGVWAASSPDLSIFDSSSIYAAVLTLSDSPDAFGWGLSTTLFGAGVVSWGSPYGTYVYLDSTFLSEGFSGLASNYTYFYDVQAVEAEGVYLEGSVGALVYGLDAFDGSAGVAAVFDSNTTVEYASVNDSSIGFEGEFLANTTAAYFDVNDSTGLGLYDTVNTTAEGFFLNDSLGLEFEFGNNATVSGVYAYNDTLGVALYGFDWANVSTVYANASLGVVDYDNFGGITQVSSVTAVNGSLGVLGEHAYDLIASHVTANSTSPLEPSTGVALNYSYFDEAYNVTSIDYSYGVNVTDSAYISVWNVSAGGDPAVGVVLDEAYGISVYDVTATDDGVGVGIIGSDYVDVWNVLVNDSSTGIIAIDSGYLWVWNTTATGSDSAGFEGLGVSYVWAWNLTASGYDTFGFDGRYVSHVWVRNTTASDESFGVVTLESNNVSVWNTTATGVAVGVAFVGDNDSWANNTSATDWSVGVGLIDTTQVHVTNVSASDPFTTNPWVYTYVLGAPSAAVVSEDTVDSTVANVVATDYPVAVYDNSSFNLFVQTVNASYGDFGLMLNGTEYSDFSGISAYDDVVGAQVGADFCYDSCEVYTYQAYGNIISDSSFVGEQTYGVELLNESYDNVVTSSSFVGDSSYGVALLYGSYDNLVYNNDFIGNNGATGTYDATHIQAYSSETDNAFNSTGEIGNYWADWHTYADGVLAPYYISSGAWDYHPLGAPEGTFAVTFEASGLPSGTSWSVTLGGVTQSTVGTSIVFNEYPGTYAYSVGALAGWSISPSSGSVVVSTEGQNVVVSFSQLYTVSFSESGLPSETSWSVVLDGVLETGSGTTLDFSVVGGTYSYSVLAPTGWAASPASGTATVAGNYLVPVAFTSTVAPTYTVTIEESGLSTGTSWSAVFDGVQETTTGTSLAFTVAAGGPYAYQVGSVAGYSVSPSSGTATVSGNYVISVTYTSTVAPTYTVWINETGLTTGTSWSAVFDGVQKTTTGASLAFTVAAGGPYAYQIGSVAGYSVSPSSGTATVSGNYVISVTYSSTVAPTYTVWINETGLTTGTSWSAIFNGVSKTTTGASLTFTVAAGTYAYQVGSVSGYNVSPSSGLATVGGGYTISVTYTSSSSSSATTFVPKTTFNEDVAIALGLAALAVVIGLVALLRKPRTPTPAPATAWQEPPAAEGSGASGGSPGH